MSLIYKAWHDQGFCDLCKNLTYEDIEKYFMHSVDVALFYEVIHLEEKSVAQLYKKTKSRELLARMMEILNEGDDSNSRPSVDQSLIKLKEFICKHDHTKTVIAWIAEKRLEDNKNDCT